MYEFTFTDENHFTRPWTAAIPFRRTDGPLFEYACHEGNIGMHGIMAGPASSTRSRSRGPGRRRRLRSRHPAVSDVGLADRSDEAYSEGCSLRTP